MLNGIKKPVADGAIADFAVVAARTGSSGRDSDISLFIVDLKAGGVEVKSLTNLDPTRGQAELTFKNCKAEPLARPAKAGASCTQVLDRAAVLWHSSRSAAPTARWRWAATTRSTVSPSAVRSVRPVVRSGHHTR